MQRFQKKKKISKKILSNIEFDAELNSDLEIQRVAIMLMLAFFPIMVFFIQMKIKKKREISL